MNQLDYIKNKLVNFIPALTTLTLLIIFVMSFCVRIFSVIKYESIIHEFDPWFNYRSTKVAVEEGLYNFLNKFDERAWYPLGRIVGGTAYPGLMLTSGFVHWLLHNVFLLPLDVRLVCVWCLWSCHAVEEEMTT